MNEKEEINKLIKDLAWFDEPQNRGQPNDSGDYRDDHVKKLVKKANEVVTKGVVEDRDEKMAIWALNENATGGHKVEPASVSTKNFISKTKGLGIRGEQLSEFEKYIVNAESKGSLLDETRIITALNTANIPQFYYEKIKSFIPTKPFVLTEQVSNVGPSQSESKPSKSGSVVGNLAGLATSFLAGGPMGSVVKLAGGSLVNKGLTVAARNKQLFTRSIVGVVGSIGASLVGVNPIIGFGMGFGAMMLIGAVSAGTASAAAASLGQAIPAVIGGLGASILGAFAVPLVIGIVATPIVIALILFIINSGAYITPQSSSSFPGQVTSPYIGITKTANPAGPFENGDEKLKGITYTVTITAKKGSLTNISFQNNCNVVKKGTPPACDVPLPDNAPETITPSEPFKFVYTKDFSAEAFSDTFVNDNFTVTADTTESTGEQAATSATIKIGNPPEECPAGWPLSLGSVTRGAYSTATHLNSEAIDIGVPLNSRVTARHSGVAHVLDYGTSGYGKHIVIQSTCNGQSFVSVYAHLSAQEVKDGSFVALGTEIGRSGSTGNSTGPHLHYEFRVGIAGSTKPASYENNIPPYMMNTDDKSDNPDAYIPVDIKRHCTNDCNTSITTKR